MILRNRARCRKCLQVVESKHRHDFRFCKCGAIHIDGGKDYIKRGAKDLNDIVELSINEFDLSTLVGRLYGHRGLDLLRETATRVMADYYEWLMLNIDTFEPELLTGSDIEYLSKLWDEWIGL